METTTTTTTVSETKTESITMETNKKKKSRKSSVKSSFSKFDKLARSNSTKATTNNEQQTTPVTPPVVEKTCKACGKEVFLVELMKAEKASWHRNCFRCATCSKQLSVDTYSSNEGKLYCKPHFKQLFQPKAVFDDEQEIATKPEVIIRESQPAQLPPDVVRASEKQSTGLEDIEIDVRSKFEMFENFKQNEVTSNTPVKRSGSVLSSRLLARYEGKDGEQGVPNDEIHGDLENYSDEDEDGEQEHKRKQIKNPLAAMNEIMQSKQMEQVRAKWEVGMNNNKEEISENRKAELAKFRSRLCQGKSNTLKDLYEKGGVTQEENRPTTQPNELEELRLEKAKKLREMFEKGQVTNEDEEQDEVEKRSIVERDMAVFQSDVAKQSRSLFKELDNNLSVNPAPQTPEINRPIAHHKEPESEQEVEAYVDPSIVRSTNQPPQMDDQIVKSRTTSKMLNVFRQLEESQSQKESKPRPLKQFTPPREPARLDEPSSAEESEEEEEDYDDQDDDDTTVDKEKDAFLKEVGSLARARSLRARFERWEAEENTKNEERTAPTTQFTDETIETARNLKQKFEQIQQQQQQQQQEIKIKHNVRRFV